MSVNKACWSLAVIAVIAIVGASASTQVLGQMYSYSTTIPYTVIMNSTSFSYTTNFSSTPTAVSNTSNSTVTPRITLSSYNVTPGMTVMITGTGFNPGDHCISDFFSGGGYSVATDPDPTGVVYPPISCNSSNGFFQYFFRVAPSAPPGVYVLAVYGNTGDMAISPQFTIAACTAISIVVFGSDGSTLWNGTLSNSTVGPFGTQFPLDVTRACTKCPCSLTLQLTVYSTSVRITLLNVPVPLSRVTLYQTGEVQQVATSLDGTARFRSIPAGDYTVRVDYLLTTYQTSLHVDQNGLIIVPVPFPQWMIIVGIAIILVTLVLLVRRKRKKNPKSASA